MMKKALYAGSFDPFTNGHLSIVQTAASVFDEVIICIANNSEKQRFIDIFSTKTAIEKTLKNYGLTNCRVLISNKLVADVCFDNQVDFLVRGVRNTTDYLYEENIAKINQEINPKLKTVYFRGDNDVISSSMIRELLKYGKSVDKYVPLYIARILSEKTC